MASKATKKVRHHLRDACEDELTTFNDKKSLFFDEWEAIVEKIQSLSDNYDFQAIEELNNMMIETRSGSNGKIGTAYSNLSDVLLELQSVLKYDNFDHD